MRIPTPATKLCILAFVLGTSARATCLQNESEPKDDLDVIVQVQRPAYYGDTVAVSPGGTRVAAVASDAGEVVLWDVTTRRRLASHPHEGRTIIDLEFVLNGNSLLITTDAGFEMWRTDTFTSDTWPRSGVPGMFPADLVTKGQQSIDMTVAAEAPVFAFVLAPNGEPTAFVQSAAQPELISVPGFARTVALNATGRILATVGLDAVRAFQVAEVKDGSSLDQVLWGEIDTTDRYVEALALSRDGNLIAIESRPLDPDSMEAPRIDVFELPSGKSIRTMLRPGLSVGANRRTGRMTFTPDGSGLLIDESDLRTDALKCVARWPLPEGPVRRFEWEGLVDAGFSVGSNVLAVSGSPYSFFGSDPDNPANSPSVFDLSRALDLGPVQASATTPFANVFRDRVEDIVYVTTESGQLLEVDLARAELVKGHAGYLAAFGAHDDRIFQRLASGLSGLITTPPGGLRVGGAHAWFEIDGRRQDFGAWQVGISNDGRFMGASNGPRLLVVDPVTDETVLDVQRPVPPTGELGESAFVAFAPPGRMQLIDTEGWQEEWDLSTGELLERESPDDILSTRFQDQSSVRHMAYSAALDQLVIGTETSLRVRDETTRRTRRLDYGWVSVLALSPDGSRAAYQVDGDFVIRDLATRKKIGSIPTLTRAAVFVDEDRVLAVDSDGGLIIVDATTGKILVTLYHVSPDGYVFLTPDGVYRATRSGTRAITLRSAEGAFSFSEDDMTKNRPDVVLESMGVAGRDLIEQQRNLVTKRHTRLGLKITDNAKGERPILGWKQRVPLVADERSISITVQALGSRPLRALHVAVDGVPQHARTGWPITVEAGEVWSHEIQVPLGHGTNEISVAVEDEGGLRSVEHRAVVQSLAPEIAGQVYAVALGVSVYEQDSHNLRFAARDAEDFAQAVSRIHGPSTRIFLRTNSQVTRDALDDCRTFLEEASSDDLVYVHVAGHGLRDDQDRYWFATHDVDFQDPGSRGISFRGLEDLLDGLAAQRKVLLMDTCHAGDLAQGIGAWPAAEGARNGFEVLGAPGAPPPADLTLLLEDAFGDLRRGTGAAVIAAAGGAEFAYENEALGGAFTRTVIDGLTKLTADLDGDRRLYAGELARFVADGVFEATDGRQRPVLKRENFEFGFPLLASKSLPVVHEFEDFTPDYGGFSGDGSRLWLAETGSHHDVQIVDSTTFEVLHRSPGQMLTDYVSSWDGRLLLSLTDDATRVIRVSDGALLELESDFQIDTRWAPPMPLPDGRRFLVKHRFRSELAIVTCTEDAVNLVPLDDLEGDAFQVHPDRASILVLDSAGTVHSLAATDLARTSAVRLDLPSDHRSTLDTEYDLTPDVTMIADSGKGMVGIWSTRTGEVLVKQRDCPNPTVWVEERSGGQQVICAHLSPGTTFFVDHRDHQSTLEVRSVKDDSLLRSIAIPSYGRLVLEPDARRLITLTSDPKTRDWGGGMMGIRIHDLTTGDLVSWVSLNGITVLVSEGGGAPTMALGSFGRLHRLPSD